MQNQDYKATIKLKQQQGSHG